MDAVNNDTAAVTSSESAFIEAYPDVMRRFETINKLADGYFHDIRSLLSVIMGQAGLLDSLAARPHRERSTESIQSGTGKIEKAADDLALCLAQLRELCAVSEQDMTLAVPAGDLIAALPTIIRGYNRQIKDTKNISFKFKVDENDCPDCVIVRRDIFDYIFLFLTSLMSEAICSGSFTVSIDAQQDAVVVCFDRNLIGHLGLEDLLSRLFGDHAVVEAERTTLRDKSASLSVSYRTLNERTCEVSFPIVRRRTQASESAPIHDLAEGTD
jgi:signal transduction histidine kinase